MKQKLILSASIIAVSFLSLAFKMNQEPKPWPVPDKNAKMAKPVKSVLSQSARASLYGISIAHPATAKPVGRWQ